MEMERNLQILAFIILEEAERNYMRIEKRNIRDEFNPFEIPETQFRNYFRLNKHLTINLIESLEAHHREEIAHNAIPFHLKVLACLHFYGNGSYQTPVGMNVYSCMSQPTVSRTIFEISRLITRYIMPNYVQFPVMPEQIGDIKTGFFQRTGFRGALGAIDGTHIEILAPPIADVNHPPFVYINRKGRHSINVMLICDSTMKITAVDARYPGSTHDSAVWQMSDIRRHLQQQFEHGVRNTYLLGDSGYPLEPWLLTPFMNPQNDQEENFNALHRQTRNVIERVNGTLKNKFRCLSRHRVLNYHPATAAYIIYSCVTLYNMSLNLEPNVQLDLIAENEEHNIHIELDNDILQLGRNERNNYILNNL